MLYDDIANTAYTVNPQTGRVARFNGDPAAWWAGQLLRYVLRPNGGARRDIDRAVARMNVRPPYVGCDDDRSC